MIMDSIVSLPLTATDEDIACLNLKLETAFDLMVSMNLNSFELLKMYQSHKDSLNEFWEKQCLLFDGEGESGQIKKTTLKSLLSDLVSVLAELVQGSNYAKNSPTEAGISEFGVLISKRLGGRIDNTSHFGKPMSSPNRKKERLTITVPSGEFSGINQQMPNPLQTAERLPFDFNSALLKDRRHCESDHNSVKGEQKEEREDHPLTCKKKEKIRFSLPITGNEEPESGEMPRPMSLRKKPNFGDLADEAKEQAHNSNLSHGPEQSEENKQKKKRRISSEMMMDNSPSVISMVVCDVNHILKDKMDSFDLLMRNAKSFKPYLKSTPLKKQDLKMLIEIFYYDNREIVRRIEENKIEKNNTRMLHHFNDILKQHASLAKKIRYAPKQTFEFLGFFDIVPKECIPLLNSLYDKLDIRIDDLVVKFERSKNLMQLGSDLIKLADQVLDERKKKKPAGAALMGKPRIPESEWNRVIKVFDLKTFSGVFLEPATGVSAKLTEVIASIPNYVSIYFCGKLQQLLFKVVIIPHLQAY